MSIKVLQVNASYKPAYIYGGPTMSVAKLCEALVHSEQQVDLEVFTTSANGTAELPVETGKITMVDGVKVTYCKRITKDHTHFSPQLLAKLKTAIRSAQQKEIVIHIHAWWNLVSILSCALARLFRIPVVLSPRGMLTSYTLGNRNSLMKSAIHQLMGKKLLRYCHIHATSEQEQEDVLKIVQPKSITIIPNLVSFPGKTTLQFKLPEKIFNLVFLSRIEEKKGFELLLDALANINFDFNLSVAGTGEPAYVESLKSKARSLKIDHHIQWLGHVSNDQKFKLLAQHDLMVLTSYNENFANVVVESLSVGTPVLLSDKVGLSSYVLSKKLGWISDLEVRTISENLTEAYQRREERTWVRENAPEIIAHDFSVESLVPRYMALYEKVIRSFT